MQRMKTCQWMVAALLAAFLGGCATQPASAPPTDAARSLEISTDAFQEGGAIPVKYTCDGDNVNPAIRWQGMPENTKSLAVVMEDPDAPGGTYTHWVMYNIPPTVTSIMKGLPAEGSPFTQGVNSFGKTGYGGPCPPKGQEHRYYLRVYALEIESNLPAGQNSGQLMKAIRTHILAQGEVMGKYKR